MSNYGYGYDSWLRDQERAEREQIEREREDRDNEDA